MVDGGWDRLRAEREKSSRERQDKRRHEQMLDAVRKKSAREEAVDSDKASLAQLLDLVGKDRADLAQHRQRLDEEHRQRLVRADRDYREQLDLMKRLFTTVFEELHRLHEEDRKELEVHRGRIKELANLVLSHDARQRGKKWPEEAEELTDRQQIEQEIRKALQ